VQGWLGFLKTTLIGGIVFLVPFIFAVFILGKAVALMGAVADPLARLAPVESVGGIAIVDLLAVLLVVLVCFLAGLAARTRAARRVAEGVEMRFLDRFPIYAFIKEMTASVAGSEAIGELTPILARLEDGWQIAFEVERDGAGTVVVYLPGAPNPWSGSICVMTEDRVQPLDATVLDTVKAIRHRGKGARHLLGERLRAGQPS